MAALAFAAATVHSAFSSISTFKSSIIFASAVVLLVAGPLLYVCRRLSARIEALNRQILQFSQRDHLTACLNETAFSALVDTYVDRRIPRQDAPHGAILLVHLDDIHALNRRFGYSWGNDALVRVATAIRKTVRQGDIIGRVSGNQFGVFLPGADEASCKGIADRIHQSISSIDFFPTGVHYPLTVRAGAVIVLKKLNFDELIRNAEDALETTNNNQTDWIHYASINHLSASTVKTLQ